MRLIKPHSQGGFICSNRQKRRPCADAANGFITILISRINSYLAFAFSFFYGTVFAIGCIYRKRVLSFSIATTVEVNNNCLLAKYSLFLNGERELGNSEPTLLHRTEQWWGLRMVASLFFGIYLKRFLEGLHGVCRQPSCAYTAWNLIVWAVEKGK